MPDYHGTDCFQQTYKIDKRERKPNNFEVESRFVRFVIVVLTGKPFNRNDFASGNVFYTKLFQISVFKYQLTPANSNPH